MFTIENTDCNTCTNKHIECFVWYKSVDGKAKKVIAECYECDLETDPRGAIDLEDIVEWAKEQ